MSEMSYISSLLDEKAAEYGYESMEDMKRDGWKIDYSLDDDHTLKLQLTKVEKAQREVSEKEFEDALKSLRVDHINNGLFEDIKKTQELRKKAEKKVTEKIVEDLEEVAHEDALKERDEKIRLLRKIGESLVNLSESISNIARVAEYVAENATTLEEIADYIGKEIK